MTGPVAVRRVVRHAAFWRAFRRTLTAVLVLAAGWVGLVSLNVMFPRHGAEGRYDVIVSLAPSDMRLPVALELFASGDVSDRLAISWFESNARLGEEVSPWLEQQTEVCANNRDLRVVCFEPVAVSTLGEALAFRDIVVANGWTRVLLVTDRTHAFRARYVFEQCMPDGVEVDVEVAPTDITPANWWRELVYENGAILKAIWQSNLRC